MNNRIKKSEVKVLGIDISKQSFQLHGVEQKGHVVLKKQLSRKKIAPFMANLPPCIVAMEACGGTHLLVSGFHRDGPYRTFDSVAVRQAVREVQ